MPGHPHADAKGFVGMTSTAPYNVVRGYEIYQEQTCGTCHAIEGVSKAQFAPDLTHLASRLTLGSGVFPNTEENLTKWIADPQAVKPGCNMPNFHFTPSRPATSSPTSKPSSKSRPMSSAHDSHDAHGHGHGYTSFRLTWMSSVDHKQIGILYFLTSLVFFVVAGIEALLIRTQLFFPNNHFISETTYNQMFTMHGTSMVFLVGMPMLAGFQNYFVPLMIGARDVAFPGSTRWPTGCCRSAASCSTTASSPARPPRSAGSATPP